MRLKISIYQIEPVGLSAHAPGRNGRYVPYQTWLVASSHPGLRLFKCARAAARHEDAPVACARKKPGKLEFTAMVDAPVIQPVGNNPGGKL